MCVCIYNVCVYIYDMLSYPYIYLLFALKIGLQSPQLGLLNLYRPVICLSALLGTNAEAFYVWKATDSPCYWCLSDLLMFLSTAKCHIVAALSSPVQWCLWLNQNPCPIRLLEYRTTTVELSKGTWGIWLACTYQVVITATPQTRGPTQLSNSTILVELFPSLISDV